MMENLAAGILFSKRMGQSFRIEVKKCSIEMGYGVR